MRLVKLCALKFLLVVAVSACGGSDQSPSASAGSGDGNATDGPGVDACAIVTGEDASKLFGQPANPDTGPRGATMIAQCLWAWESDTSSQLLQFHLWDPMAYDMPGDAEALDIGERGFIRRHPLAGVDVGWVQGGAFVVLAYSTVGPDVTPAMERSDQVIALARQAEQRLAK